MVIGLNGGGEWKQEKKEAKVQERKKKNIQMKEDSRGKKNKGMATATQYLIGKDANLVLKFPLL